MHEFLDWITFLGAWLLVAGPIYQAALELRDEDFNRDKWAETFAQVPRSEPVSPWWWLLPPVHYVLQRRRARRDREAMMAALTSDQMRIMLEFMNKAMGWLLVAAGAFFIAINETHVLTEFYEWPVIIFVLLVVVMVVVAVGNTVFRMLKSQQVLEHYR